MTASNRSFSFRFLLALPLAGSGLAVACGGDLPSTGASAVCEVQVDARASDLLSQVMRNTPDWNCGSGAPAQGLPADLTASDLDVRSVEAVAGGQHLRVVFEVARYHPTPSAGQCGHLTCTGEPGLDP